MSMSLESEQRERISSPYARFIILAPSVHTIDGFKVLYHALPFVAFLQWWEEGVVGSKQHSSAAKLPLVKARAR